MPKIPREKRSKSQKKWYLHLARQKLKQKTACNADRRLVMVDEIILGSGTNAKVDDNTDDNHFDGSGKDVAKDEKDADVVSLHASDNDFD